ncbi:MAG: hypothetical protein KDC44_22000 [Phaeodactylibacter sp.]|nr:hypothetical protein [Phaeodactylibacter sp.]
MAQEFQALLDAQKQWWDTWRNWSSPQATPTDWMQTPNKMMEQWMQEGNAWIRKNLWDRLPFQMRPHYSNFNTLFDELKNHWEKLMPLVQYGFADPKLLDQFFSPKAYEEIFGRFMGFKAPADLQEMMTQSSKVFDKYQELLKDSDHTANLKMMDQWSKFFGSWGTTDVHPAFAALVEVSNTIGQSMDRLFQMAGETKETEIAKLLKEIQFTYTGFLLKTAELQMLVFQPARGVLVQSLKEMGAKFQESKAMPDYQDFFNLFINRLEEAMLEVLHGDTYSKLQAEVSKLGITVKAKMDAVIELVFSDLPFLMKSHADEVARENAGLRRKIRNLESRLARLEQAVNLPAEAPADRAATTTPQDQLLTIVGLGSAATKDDLKQIKGVGPKLEKLLNGIGIYSYQQVAKMNAQAAALIDVLIPSFKGRATRDRWAEQAARLLA